MSGFSTFYFQGGFFMHLITLAGCAAGFVLLKSMKHIRAGKPERSTLDLAKGLTGLMLLLGAVGACFGVIDAGRAMQNMLDNDPNANMILPAVRVAPLIVTTLAWSLMLSVPITFVRLALSFVAQRQATGERVTG